MSSVEKEDSVAGMTSGEEIRQMIIKSAVELFDKRGYNNVKISDITSNVGMTTGAFYYYFKSKAEILEIVSNYYITIAAERAKKIYDRPDLNTKEKLALVLYQHCSGVAQYHSHVSVFYREHRNLTSDGLVNAVERNRQFLHNTAGLIQQGIDEGVFRPDLNPKVVALAMIGMCNWLYQWYSPEGEQSIEQISETFIRLVTGGLTADHSDLRIPDRAMD